MIIARFEEFRRDIVFLPPEGKEPVIHTFGVVEEVGPLFDIVRVEIIGGIVIIDFVMI